MLCVQQSYNCDPEGKPVTVDATQARILRAVAAHDRVAVRSSHGIGKTTSAAWLGHWWLSTRSPALVVTMAGTWNHLEEKLWPEIKTWGLNWRLRDAFEQQELGLFARVNGDAWRMVASSSDKPENVEGFHSPNLLLLVDEAKMMPDELWAAIRGALTQVSAAGAKPKVAVLSTPPLAKVGWYADLFGTKSAGWHTIHISGFDSTRVSRDWIAEMADDYGEDSPVYQAKVLGEIPEGSSTSVVHGVWIEAAQAQKEDFEDKRPVVLTCDVAREGEDLTVVGGIMNRKFRILEWAAKNDTMETAGRCGRLVKEEGASFIVIDDTGVGGGVTDRLRELQGQGTFPKDCQILPVQFGASAHKDTRFHSRKDELWWATRDALKLGHLALETDQELAAHAFPRGSNLKAQLTAPIYEEDSQSRVRVLDKKVDNREKTRALPTKSPDLAHSLILGVSTWWKQPQMEAEEAFPTNLHELRAKQIRETLAKERERRDGPAGSGPAARRAIYRRNRR